MRNGWTRRYPPLSGAVVATVLAVFILPSALNVPQSNPTQTLEFAPIPPEADDPPPPDESSNVESLSLGSSSSSVGDAPGGDGAGPGRPEPGLPGGIGQSPVTKRCVGTPPRQTEDAMSPPCVAHFEGDNGDATANGVDRDEVRILFYATPPTCRGSDRGYECGETNDTFWDLADPPEPDESYFLRNMRRFQRYFNERYQTYGRFVHFFVYIQSTDANQLSPTPETRRADAAYTYGAARPFAVVSGGTVTAHSQIYHQEMARRGVVNFGSNAGSRPADVFREHPGLLWSYPPSIEVKSRLYSSYACSNVVGRPVSDSGNVAADGESENGQPRRLGLIWTTDTRYPELQLLADLVRTQIEDCGGEFVEEGTFPTAGYQSVAVRGQDSTASYASQNMATFQAAGVTTVVWAGGYETEHTKAAARIGYDPEWVLAGDGQLEGRANTRVQGHDGFRHATVISNAPRVDSSSDGVTERVEGDPCREALTEADDSIGESDLTAGCTVTIYEDLRQLFTGIQVAGPRLTAATMDQGFHAIPAVRSEDPRVPACYYEPSDYTCVKDATIMWWDVGNGQASSANDGCWRMVDGGQRHLIDRWPSAPLGSWRSPSDPCNAFETASFAF